MIVVKYSKIGGAQFISHLDTLKHIQKTIIRAKAPVEYSKGFNPHMLVYLSAPMGVGIASKAEYFYLETPMSAQEFLPLFNANCPRGFKASLAIDVSKNPNLQALIDSAEYYLEGDYADDIPQKIMALNKFVVKDKKGEERDLRARILDVKKCDNGLIARLSFGNETLRADVFAEKLKQLFGVECEHILKTDCYIKGIKAEEYILREF
ncbi:MAG: TIGR03936 family radical SAM-associated protein [Clostridia bacterium]|nr:TIGR03936 family radical SAM-associated protein [Clostridia bacterium]